MSYTNNKNKNINICRYKILYGLNLYCIDGNLLIKVTLWDLLSFNPYKRAVCINKKMNQIKNQ